MKAIITFLMIFLSFSSVLAQRNDRNPHYFKTDKNIVKVNATSPIIGNYAFQYERVLNKRLSAAVSYRFMPESNIPFKSRLIDLSDDKDAATDAIENTKLSNYAFTPELRVYLGKKGYGKGFYIAPFFRHAKYSASQFRIKYDIESPDPNYAYSGTLDLSGDLTANTFGLLIGAQWFLGKRVILDWWILGPHAGSGKGNLTGISDRLLTDLEQREIYDKLEDIEIPFADKTVEVNSRGANMKLDGLWGGLRAGLSIGVKF